MKGKITIRISDSLRTKLSEKSEAESTSVSEIARTILEQYFISLDSGFNENTTDDFLSQSVEEEKYSDETTFLEEFDYDDIDIVYTTEFLQLVLWMFDQRESRLLKLDKIALEEFKNTILKIHSSSIMEQSLKDEFNKVFVDLIKELKSSYPFSCRTDFAMVYRDGFNYELLNKFIFNENLGTISITF